MGIEYEEAAQSRVGLNLPNAVLEGRKGKGATIEG